MNSLVRPSSSPGRQLGQHLIDGSNVLGMRNLMTHSPLSVNVTDENVSRYTGSGFKAVQAILEQPSRVLSVNTQMPGDRSSTDFGSCTLGTGMSIEDGVAEFKGPAVHGLVRFAQVNHQEARIEAEFDGLTPGMLLCCSVNEYGDLRKGAASTGNTYSPLSIGSLSGAPVGEAAPGILGHVTADSTGHAEFVGTSSRLAVWDVIGRSVVLYQISGDEQKSCPSDAIAIAAAVIARSSARGTVAGALNRLCACDGTVVWQSR